jgi:cardiolipin synthase (CMP-forming)
VVSLPNFISIARLMCVPLLVWLIVTGDMAAAFWVFVAAGVSDAVDGYIAKTFNARTALGRYIDPLADKTLLVSVFVTLGLRGDLPDWLVILVVFRDLLIVGGALLFHTLTDRSMRMDPILISKANTLLQILLIGVVLAGLGVGLDDHGAALVLIYAVAATTVLSGAAYVVRWVRGTAEVGKA